MSSRVLLALLLALLLCSACLAAPKPAGKSGGKPAPSHDDEDVGDDAGGDDGGDEGGDEDGGDVEGGDEGVFDADKEDGDDLPADMDGKFDEEGDDADFKDDEGGDLEGEGDDDSFVEDEDKDFPADQEGDLANFVQFQVEEALEIFESNDPEQIAKIFGEHVRASWLGKSFTSPADLAAAMKPWLDKVAVTRFLVTSRTHETSSRAQFTATLFQQSKAGCAVAVDSLFDLSFDKDGRVESLRAEWALPENVILQQLDCTGAAAATESPAEQRAGKLLQDLHQAISNRDYSAIVDKFAEDAVLKTPGVPDAVGNSAIASMITPMYLRMRASHSSITSRVYARPNAASYIHVQFVVTVSGCSGTYEQVSHVEFDDAGKIKLLDITVVGTSVTEWGQELNEDCGENAQGDEPASQQLPLEQVHSEGNAEPTPEEPADA